MSCTSDPFSCSNLNETQGDGPGTANQSGLVWEVEKVLTGIGDRPCWNFSQYDDFNVLNAQACAQPRPSLSPFPAFLLSLVRFCRLDRRLLDVRAQTTIGP